MQLKYLKTIVTAQDGPAKIMAIAWAPNNLKLAVCNSERVIVLFDEHGEKRDKFPTKPADSKNGRKSYFVKGLAFSPDSTKLAVGQTDNIIYIYKIGDDWGDKKVICNKFVQQCPVTCLIWLTEGPIIYGQTDGKVRAAHVKANKTQTLFATNSYVASLASNVRGTGFLSGHADGTIVRYYIAEDPAMEQQGRLLVHPVPPYALAWPIGFVVAAGCDRKVTIYDRDGRQSKQFDYPNEKEFETACCSPSGQAVAVASYDRIRVYAWSPRKCCWEEEPAKEIADMYSIGALSWKRDGSRIAGGGLCGSVELFESVLKRTVWKNKFEMTYVGPSQVLVKPMNSDARGVILKSQYGHEIDDVRIMGADRYLLARTPDTLLLGLYLFIIFFCLSNDVIEFCFKFYRTEFMNPHLISVRLNERRQLNSPEDNKKLAYLLDMKTISIVDLIYGMTILQISHDSKIDWLELNETGHKLLFRDKKMRLTLLDTRSAERHSILSYCTFVQWVTGSDVVVAQSRNNACVWYNIDNPDRITSFTIKGEIFDVVRNEGKTEILTQDGTHQMGYELDEGLVEFGTAVHDSDFGRAVLFLESVSRPEAEGMWQNLAEIALQLHNLTVAERCYAALGDISRTYYLRETLKIAQDFAKQNGGDGMDCPEVWARMAILNKQLKTAEAIYLEQNELEKALDMYKNLHKWDEAIELAEMKGYRGLKELQAKHMQWLMETRQEEKAGELKEKAGDLGAALNLYLKAGLASKAARLVLSERDLLANEDVVSRVVSALTKGEHFTQAGQLYEAIKGTDKALECYRKGHSYSKAVELARSNSPKEVVNLEEEWGDYLVSNKQMDAAINHYIEAGKTVKALDAAMGARQWKKAVQIIQVIDDPSLVEQHYGQLARHFALMKDFRLAEQLYMQASLHKEAIDMYNNSGNWEKAYSLANRFLEPEQVTKMFIKQGQSLEQIGKLKDAEKLYVAVKQPDLAISMYKSQRQFEQMMRLVTEYHPELVSTTHMHLGQQMEAEGNYKLAETHYIAGAEWKLAVKMYRGIDMWEDAHRIAKLNGGEQAGQQVAFLWAKSLGGDSAVKLLNKFDLVESCIDYACDSYQFDFAFDLARSGMKSKMADIHCKYAMALEDDGKFELAEKEFVKAMKPKEAVLMYIHNQDWENAERVAEQHDEQSMSLVLLGQAKEEFSNKNFAKFESLLLRAHRPELIIKHYQDCGMWVDALRVCREYLPSQMAQLQAEYERQVGSRGLRDVSTILNQAQQWEQSGEFKTAIDCYLRVNKNNCKDPATIIKALTEAANIITKYLDNEEAYNLAKIVGPRLVEVKQYNLAAQVYLAVDMIKEAIDTFILADEWSKAKKIAHELEPSYESYVDSCYKESLKKQGSADQLADVDIISALDLLSEQGQWTKCLETAKPHGPEVLHKYVALYATHLIKEGYSLKALSLYVQLDAPPFPQNYNIYRRIATDILAMPGLDGPDAFEHWAHLRDMLYGLVSANLNFNYFLPIASTTRANFITSNIYAGLPCNFIQEGYSLKALSLYVQLDAPPFPQNYNIYRRIATDILAMPGLDGPDAFEHWAHLRDMLYGLTESMRSTTDGGGATHVELDTLMRISHYYAVRTACRPIKALEEIVCRISIALLRHSDIIPADKAYYEAGIEARNVGRESEAFVLLNHYLDVVEAIEEGSPDLLDHSDFSNTDFPAEIALPATPYLDNQQHEAIKEWVLAISMDQNVDQVLPVDDRNLYESSLGSADSASAAAVACIVTGYPVVGVASGSRGQSAVQFKRPGCAANKDDWNKLTMAAKMAPTNTALADVVRFIGEFCGANTNFSFI
ncbi:intraflagellar transport protein 172 homolog [Nilaparvata lugens]|uniref:intraflagellar transport protein 172 homolog n=1 Tax=Nilaparvata lugens TaxID=108931 RepID=UPI00193C87CC|nr:intraflagellar transport protein 172 homolog [Nilaparvata lugens]